MRRSVTVLLAVGALLYATEARAQGEWDAPSFLPPRPGEDVGVYVSDQGDFAVEGIWRQRGNPNLGVRLGYIDVYDGGLLVGAETWGRFFTVGPEYPVDASWAFGLGAIIASHTVVEIPGGITVGRTFDLEPVKVQLYGYPRLALLIRTDPFPGQDRADLDGLFDIGGDVLLRNDMKVRIGITFGGTGALGVGLAWQFGRGVEVH